MAAENGVGIVAVHCFLDGRDVPPRCAEKYITALEEHMKKKGLGSIATVSGRYYAWTETNDGTGSKRHTTQ